MPYTGASDSKLPPNVQSLPTAKRRQWVAVFNDTLAGCTGDGCDGKAMKTANAAVKELSDDSRVLVCSTNCKAVFGLPADAGTTACPECGQIYYFKDGTLLTKEKCMEMGGGESPMPVIEVEALGGATTFAEADQYLVSARVSGNVMDLRYQFDDIINNI